MLVNSLFHIAIKSPDIEATRQFYCDVLGMTLAERPPLGFPGYWIQSPLPGGVAMFHIYGGDEALEEDGSMASGCGVIDHVSLSCQGFYEIKKKLDECGLDYRQNIVQSIRLWQLFVYDPSGVLLELSFSQDAETGVRPEFTRAGQYKARERFFSPDAYGQFGK